MPGPRRCTPSTASSARRPSRAPTTCPARSATSGWTAGASWSSTWTCTRPASARGVEYIGFDEASGELRSHFFGSGGEILEYTYRLEGDLLTIWFGGPDSRARFEGRFS